MIPEEEFEPGTQVTCAATGATRIGCVIDDPDTTASAAESGRYSVEWPDGTRELLPAAVLTTRTLTALLDASHGHSGSTEWTIETTTNEIPLGAPGRCEHIFTICEDCAHQWASDYIFIDPWPDDWMHHPPGPLP